MLGGYGDSMEIMIELFGGSIEILSVRSLPWVRRNHAHGECIVCPWYSCINIAMVFFISR